MLLDCLRVHENGHHGTKKIFPSLFSYPNHNSMIFFLLMHPMHIIRSSIIDGFTMTLVSYPFLVSIITLLVRKLDIGTGWKVIQVHRSIDLQVLLEHFLDNT